MEDKEIGNNAEKIPLPGTLDLVLVDGEWYQCISVGVGYATLVSIENREKTIKINNFDYYLYQSPKEHLVTVNDLIREGYLDKSLLSSIHWV